MVSSKCKPCPWLFSSSKVNCIFGFIEFRCLWTWSTWSFLKQERLSSTQRNHHFGGCRNVEISSISSITRSAITMGTIIFYFRKPTRASREHELHGHTRKLCVTLLSIAYDNEFHFHFTDEGLSITRNICYQLSRVSGKPFTWQNLICVVMFLISSTDNITFHWMSQGLRQMKMSARCLAKWHCYSNSHLKKITPFVFITDFNHWCKNPGS